MFFAFVIDAYSRRIVGWQFAAHMRTTLVDNAVAESFVDTFKTELIADRTWATRSQLELAVVEYVAWFNNERLHEMPYDRPPREVEELYAGKKAVMTPTQ